MRGHFGREDLNEITECDRFILSTLKELATNYLVLREHWCASVLPKQFYVLKPGLHPDYFVSDNQEFITFLLADG